MNSDIYTEIQAALKRGKHLVVATVIKTMGAAPCNIGSKMLIRNGQRCTIEKRLSLVR